MRLEVIAILLSLQALTEQTQKPRPAARRTFHSDTFGEQCIHSYHSYFELYEKVLPMNTGVKAVEAAAQTLCRK